MTKAAFAKLYCTVETDGFTYWLVTPEDYTTCKQTSGGGRGRTLGGNTRDGCEGFDLPPGHDKLQSNKYGVTRDDVILG
ncbi:hypothetical protein IMZ48_45455 [Candidatus Bathyarchaeota archaeon]|nr:hypothetical protein [Candidatus Bathyarchaeota archaeon]